MADQEKRIFGISRTVILLGAVSLFTDVSSEGIYPLIPLFLTNVLHTQILAIGLIEGVAESTASILRVFSGYFSDRLGNRKWITVIGYSLSMISKPLLSVTTGWHQVLGIRFADRVGKGIRSAPRDALIADITPMETRGVSFGFHRAMDTTGAVAGPLIAFWMLKSLGIGYRHIFLLSAVPAVLGVLILVLFVREAVHKTRVSGEMPSLHLGMFSRQFKKFLLVTGLFSLGNSSDVFLILRAQNVGVSAESILLIYVLFNSIEATLTTAAGAISDRLGRRTVILAGYIVFAVVYAGFGLAGSPAEIWIFFALYGLYNALTGGVQRAFAADLIGSEIRGTGLGAYHTLTGLALLPASLIAGYLWKALNPSAPFFFGAMTALISALLLIMLFRSQPICTDT